MRRNGYKIDVNELIRYILERMLKLIINIISKNLLQKKNHFV